MSMTSGRTRAAIAAGAVAAAVAAVIGWAIAGSGDRAEQLAAATTPRPTAAGAPASADPAAGPGDPAAGLGDPAGPGPTRGGQRDGSGQPPGGDRSDGPPQGPQVEMFQVVQEPRCPAGTDANPIDGQPVILQWRVTGVDEVSLSIDGLGVYASYPAEGSDTFAFQCGGEEGDIEKHTYLLTAVAGGHTVTEELVVTAVVHERTDV